jgi:hypothetical protein
MPTQTCTQGGLLALLGSLLGVRADEAEAVLRHDDRRAQSTVRMQRRSFLGAAAAMAAAPFVPKVFVGPISIPYSGIYTIRERVHQPFGWDFAGQIAASIHALYDTPLVVGR